MCTVFVLDLNIKGLSKCLRKFCENVGKTFLDQDFYWKIFKMIYIYFVGRSTIKSIRHLDHFSTCFKKSSCKVSHVYLFYSQVLHILLVFGVFSYAGVSQTLFERYSRVRLEKLLLYFIKRYFTTTIWTGRKLQF